TPGLARVVEALELDVSPAHAALGDAQATAAVFRELVARGRERFGWSQIGDLLSVLPRPEIDRSRIAPGAQPPRQRGGRPEGPGARSVRSRSAVSRVSRSETSFSKVVSALIVLAGRVPSTGSRSRPWASRWRTAPLVLKTCSRRAVS